MEDWKIQSSLMRSIYSNSSCNIAAAWAEDSDQGCFHERDPDIMNSMVSIAKDWFGIEIKLQESYHNLITNSPLNQRGWVVQERCLARKQLSFAKDQVFWECAQLSACEQLPHGIPLDTLTMMGGSIHKPGGLILGPPSAKPRLTFADEFELRQIWCSLAQHYSICAFSRATDKTIALAGLARFYQERTGDTYLAGLWTRYFYQQLFWRTEDPGVTEVMHLRSARCHAPSWSWLSLDQSKVRMDKLYFRQKQHTCSLKLLDVRIKSESPGDLHSFTDCEIKIQAIAVWVNYNP